MKNSQYLFTYIKENRPSSLYIVATFTHVILKLLQINGDSKNTKILIENLLNIYNDFKLEYPDYFQTEKSLWPLDALLQAPRLRGTGE